LPASAILVVFPVAAMLVAADGRGNGGVPTFGMREVERAVDEAEVRKRLREIAQELARGGVDLLGEEADCSCEA
jgi:hypothetical protein